jgi:hypothetical protein
MPSRTDTDRFTSLPVRESTKERLESLRPFRSMSWSEFAEVLADAYEDQHEP